MSEHLFRYDLECKAKEILGPKIIKQLETWFLDYMYVSDERMDLLDQLIKVPKYAWTYINHKGHTIKFVRLSMSDIRDNDYSMGTKDLETEVKTDKPKDYIKKVLDLQDLMNYARKYNINWVDMVEDVYLLEDHFSQKSQ